MIYCLNCGAAFTEPGVGRPPRSPLPPQAGAGGDNPWTPTQIFAGSFVFGPLAGGALAGLNFAHMGKQAYLVPCIVVGAVLFALVLLAAFLLPEGIPTPVSMVVSLAIGLGFLLMQKSTFDAWKAANWAPAREGDRYKPNRVGQLFLVGLLCMAIEVGVILPLVLLRIAG